MFIFARKSLESRSFTAILKNSKWSKRDDLINRFLRHSGNVSDEAFIVSQFISSAFSLTSKEDEEFNSNNEDDYSDSDRKNTKQGVHLKLVHKIEDRELRRTFIKLSRCSAFNLLLASL